MSLSNVTDFGKPEVTVTAAAEVPLYFLVYSEGDALALNRAFTKLGIEAKALPCGHGMTTEKHPLAVVFVPSHQGRAQKMSYYAGEVRKNFERMVILGGWEGE